jgi:hypothetical protein
LETQPVDGATTQGASMLRQIAMIGAATLFALSVATAQTSAPSSTAGGAVGTSKTGTEPKAAKAPKKGTKAAKGVQSSPESTAGGAVGTSKKGNERNPR